MLLNSASIMYFLVIYAESLRNIMEHSLKIIHSGDFSNNTLLYSPIILYCNSIQNSFVTLVFVRLRLSVCSLNYPLMHCALKNLHIEFVL